MTRLLYWGSSPTANSGYGVAAAQLAPRLQARGIDTAIYAMAGQHGESAYDGIPVFGNRGRRDIGLLPAMAQAWRADRILAWTDLWNVADELAALGERPVLGRPLTAYAVIDSEPLAPAMRRALYRADDIVFPTQYAKDTVLASAPELAAIVPTYNVHPTPIPHGVDTNVYRPMPTKEAKNSWGVDESTFVFLTVATNVDFRKNLSGMMRAYAEFLSRSPRPERYLWMVWTDPNVSVPGSYDLHDLWDSMGQPDTAFWTPTGTEYALGQDSEGMARLYNAGDVLFSCSYGEGFGFPVIEAFACGVPVIASDNTAYKELIVTSLAGIDLSAARSIPPAPRGWLVDCTSWIAQPRTNAWQRVPSHERMVDALTEAALTNPGQLRLMGEATREAAVRLYDWDKVADQWVRVLNA